MKYIYALLFILVPTFSQADILRTIKEEPVTVKYNINALTSSTSTILIDLSDTSNFPHKNSGAIDIAAISVSIDKAATSSGTIKLGVLNVINPSTGSVSWFYEAPFERSAAGTEVVKLAPQNTWLHRLRVASNGTTPFLLTSDKTLGSTIYQSDVVLPCPTGTDIAPGLGDIILSVTNNGSGAIDFNVEVLYGSER